jgi:hypothetical protein
MEVDYTMREKIAMERAKQIMAIKEANESSSNINDSLDKSLNSSKQQHRLKATRPRRTQRRAHQVEK